MSSEARTNVSGSNEGKHYPPPLASHNDIINDSTLFWNTLRRFHFLMATKFMIPVIGGKELDLHVLYVEVTRRSGYEKVVVEKKWREVGSVFRFSSTTTSASFVLRKHYLNLLYHYEQVHFFKVQGPIITPSLDASSGNSPSWRPELAIVQYSPKMVNDSAESHDEVNVDSSCLLGKGTIKGKFDCGYIVSVKLGSEVLNGVLYHPEHVVAAPSLVPQHAIVPFNLQSHSSGRRKRRKRKWDPNYPKPNRSGYNFFFAEKHYKLKELYPNREREFTKMIGQSWNSLSPEERMIYQNIGLRDKERYKRELTEYKEKMKVGQTVELGLP